MASAARKHTPPADGEGVTHALRPHLLDLGLERRDLLVGVVEGGLVLGGVLLGLGEVRVDDREQFFPGVLRPLVFLRVITGHAVADVVERLGVGLREVGQRHAQSRPVRRQACRRSRGRQSRRRRCAGRTCQSASPAWRGRQGRRSACRCRPYPGQECRPRGPAGS